MPGRGGRTLLLVATTALALPVAAATGRVTDGAGQPLAGARVCHWEPQQRIEMLCVTASDDGEYEIPDSAENVLRVSAEGFFSVEVPASGHRAVALEPSPTLTVFLVDAASGERLAEGEVFVVYTSARRQGPFPANRAGVRIQRVLEPGAVRLIGRAPGYAESEPVALTLVGGQAAEAVLELRRAAPPAKP